MHIQQYEFLREAKPLMDKYSHLIKPVKKAINGLNDYQCATIAILADNVEKQLKAYKRAKNMSDANYSEQVGPYIKHAMNIVSTLYTTMDLEELISIQPFKQKLGAFYFLNYTYATTKGDILAGETLFSATTKPKWSGNYSTQKVKNEAVTFGNVGANTVAALQYYPLYNPEMLELTIEGGTGAGTYTFLTLVGSTISLQKNLGGAAVGTVSQLTGAVVLSGNHAATITGATCTYKWNSEKFVNKNQIPRIKISVDEVIVQAERRNLLFEIMLDASYDFDQQFGRDMNAELQSTVTQALQNELAFLVLENMMDGATGNNGTTFSFNLTPDPQLSLQDHLQTFYVFLEDMSMQIYKNLGRGMGNKIVSGNDLMKVLRTLPSTIWEPIPNSDIKGPYKAGVLLGKYSVFHNPAYEEDEFMMTYRGESWWEASYYLGTYLPMMQSKFMMFPDMHGEQGYLAMEAHRYMFPQHTVKGSVYQSAPGS